MTVSYDENGALLEKLYRKKGLPIDVFIKKGAIIIRTV